MAEMSERYMLKAREQYAELQEQIATEKKAQADAEASGTTYMPPMQKLVEGVPQAIKDDVDAVMEAATGWNLDSEFNAENLAKFFSLYARAAVTIASDYRVSMNEGRLGN